MPSLTYIDGAAHESALAVSLEHEGEELRWSLGAQILPVRDAAREVLERLTHHSTAQRLVGSTQPGVSQPETCDVS